MRLSYCAIACEARKRQDTPPKRAQAGGVERGEYLDDRSGALTRGAEILHHDSATPLLNLHEVRQAGSETREGWNDEPPQDPR